MYTLKPGKLYVITREHNFILKHQANKPSNYLIKAYPEMIVLYLRDSGSTGPWRHFLFGNKEVYVSKNVDDDILKYYKEI